MSLKTVQATNYQGIIVGWEHDYFRMDSARTQTAFQKITVTCAFIFLQIKSLFNKHSKAILRAYALNPYSGGPLPLSPVLIRMRKCYLSIIMDDSEQVETTEAFIQIATWETAEDIQRIITSSRIPSIQAQTANSLLQKSQQIRARSEALHQAFMQLHGALHAYTESPSRLLFSSLNTQAFKRAVDEFRVGWL